MDTDRNLLFGVIAMQAGLIEADQFIEVCSTWAARKDVGLADLIVERGWMTDTDRSHVEYLLERRLEKHAGNVQASLGIVPVAIQRSLASIGDEEIQHSIVCHRPDRDELAETQVFAVNSADSTETVGRYELSELHATGGMGRVWCARDKTLKRRVALKELKPELRNDNVLRARFDREAEITGQLEHPGIVPVYDFVSQPDLQRSFYTMRFVKGRTLAEAARQFHEDRTNGAADNSAFVTLLNAFVDVCNAVAFAHSRGIIHRDLKGQNVVLGDFGETVVLDWGFAKRSGDGEPDGIAHSQGDPIAAGDSELTAQGEAMGTPAFMSPEQAAGLTDGVDYRSDIYGLGAVLYQILTANPPFSGSTIAEVVGKVAREEPEPVSDVWPDVPPELEAACRKAMAKNPEARYSSAMELAAEVEGWQETQRRRMEQAWRESEAFYEALVESLPQGIVRKDVEGHFTYANHGACELLAVPREKLIGKTDFDIGPDELAEKYRRDDHEVMKSGRPKEMFEQNETIGAPVRTVQTIKTPVYDLQGNPIGIQAIFWDVTEQRQMQESLQQKTEEVDRLRAELETLRSTSE